MIELKMTPEFFEDIFTANLLNAHVCTEGLPKDAKFLGIGVRDGNIVAQFNDGKINISRPCIKFEAVPPVEETFVEKFSNRLDNGETPTRLIEDIIQSAARLKSNRGKK